MTEPNRPEDQATIEEIAAPAWDTATTVDSQVSAANVAPADAPAAPAGRTSRRGFGARWIVALVGVIVIVASSAVIVALAAGRPASSAAMGYMPDSTMVYTEARLDLPGDQKQKLGSFLAHAVPGFDDQAQLDVKLNDVLDRLTKAASDGKQTWSTDIAPWFGGQVAIGQGVPKTPSAISSSSSATSPMMSGLADSLVVVTITDRAKAEAWLTSLTDSSSINKTTENGVDYFQNADSPERFTLAVTDKAFLAGSEAAVKAAVATNGKGSFADNDDVKAALATVDRDGVGLTIVRTRAYLDGLTNMIANVSPGALDKTQIDETLLGMVPAWQASTIRFENDELAFTSASPAWSIGYDTSNHASALLGHVPPKTVLYAEAHDVGQVLKAILDKFRALPETKPAFDAFDQAIAVLGGYDGVFGWWGDAAFVVTPVADGTIGGGIVIQPRDAAAAARFFTTLDADLGLAGGSMGAVVRQEDHNGTKITVLDLSAVHGMDLTSLPPGYKAELAWATNADVAVLGYGRDFVAAVLDAGPGASLGDDARFKGLVDRVGAQNIALGYLDIAGIRGLIEPLIQQHAPADKWAAYEKDIKPYLEHFDAVIGATRKDGSQDRGSGALTVR